MRIAVFTIITFVLYSFALSGQADAFIIQEEGKILLVDRMGEKWDISQAVSLGFDPKLFQYGIGRNAFVPLDESGLNEDTEGVSPGLRVIGIAEGEMAHAYSVPTLTKHEVANTSFDQDPVAVAY